MDKLRKVINDVLQQSLMDTSTVNHYTTLLAECITREFCLQEHQLDLRRFQQTGSETYCKNCGKCVEDPFEYCFEHNVPYRKGKGESCSVCGIERRNDES